MKAVCTITKRIEYDEPNPPRQPKYGIGDYMEVYSGQHEGYGFWVQDIRWNADTHFDGPRYEYQGMFGFQSDWKGEDGIILLRRALNPKGGDSDV